MIYGVSTSWKDAVGCFGIQPDESAQRATVAFLGRLHLEYRDAPNPVQVDLVDLRLRFSCLHLFTTLL